MKTNFSKLMLLALVTTFSFVSCEKDDAEAKKYILSVIAEPANGGTVSGGGEFNAGTDVALTATPNADYNFVNWKNGNTVVSTDANFTYTTTEENVTLTATFALKTYTLSLNITTPAGSGIVTGGGDYSPGTAVSLVATPGSGWAFSDWSKGSDIISTDATYSYTTTAEDVTISASFIRVYALAVTTNLVNSGIVTGGGNYEVGTNVTLTATPSIGYTFVNWTKGGNEVSTSASFSYTTTNVDETIVANFTEKTYNKTLGAQANANGGFYSISQDQIYTLEQAFSNQDKIDFICFYELANDNYITISSPGANITNIFTGQYDFANWTSPKRTTYFTPPVTPITVEQFDALHQNDPSIQTYFNSGMSSGNKKAKNLVVDNIYAFKTQDNVYGLFKVVSVSQGDTGLVQVEFKFRK